MSWCLVVSKGKLTAARQILVLRVPISSTWLSNAAMADTIASSPPSWSCGTPIPAIVPLPRAPSALKGTSNSATTASRTCVLTACVQERALVRLVVQLQGGWCPVVSKGKLTAVRK